MFGISTRERAVAPAAPMQTQAICECNFVSAVRVSGEESEVSQRIASAYEDLTLLTNHLPLGGIAMTWLRPIFLAALACAAISFSHVTKAAESTEATVTCKDGTSSKPGKGACSHHGGVQVPAGATAQCKDGTFWLSKAHSGACSSHGGVAKWLDGTTQ